MWKAITFNINGVHNILVCKTRNSVQLVPGNASPARPGMALSQILPFTSQLGDIKQIQFFLKLECWGFPTPRLFQLVERCGQFTNMTDGRIELV